VAHATTSNVAHHAIAIVDQGLGSKHRCYCAPYSMLVSSVDEPCYLSKNHLRGKGRWPHILSAAQFSQLIITTSIDNFYPA
jgi:hypothetical protein